MSAYVVISCDAENSPGDRCMAEDSPFGSPRTATEARRRLHREGWRRTHDGQDLCPTHADQRADDA